MMMVVVEVRCWLVFVLVLIDDDVVVEINE